jgi:hypothetical protein
MIELTPPLIWQMEKHLATGETVCRAEAPSPDKPIPDEYIIHHRVPPTGDGATVRYEVIRALYEGESPRGPYWREVFCPYRYFSLNQAQWAAEYHRRRGEWLKVEAAWKLSRIGLYSGPFQDMEGGRLG